MGPLKIEHPQQDYKYSNVLVHPVVQLSVHHPQNRADSRSCSGSKRCPFQGKSLAFLQGNHVYEYAKEFLKRYMSSGGLMMTGHVLRILWS